MAPELIVWDFDGVLNRNIIDGRFVWADQLDADLGLSLTSLQSFFFASGRIKGVMRGHEDLRDVVTEWLDQEGASITPDEFLAYWFSKDARGDDDVLGELLRHPARHVIGTNNEARRAGYIENELGYGRVVERIFASGRLGVAKPDAAFFNAIAEWSGLAPDQILLIDDTEANVVAAQQRGWRAFHFTDATRNALPSVLYA